MTQLFVDTLANEAGTGPTELTGQSAAKAYLVYNQNANTLNGSLNISSITDNSSGVFTATFTNNFANVSYSESGIVRSGDAGSDDDPRQQIIGYRGTATEDNVSDIRLNTAVNGSSATNPSLNDAQKSCWQAHGTLA
jgi:hypothetical protein